MNLENKQYVKNNLIEGGGKISAIQTLRFFSALAVSFFHIGFLDSLSKDYNIWFVNGVFIFYAISGYVTMLSTERGSEKFMVKRLIKIFPIYWFLTFATFAAMKIMPSAFPYNPSFSELLKSLFLIPYAHQSTATASAMYPIVSMGHTIQTTMLYYLVFWGMAKLSHERRGLLSSIIIVAIVVCGYLFKPTSVFLKFYLKPDLIFFIAGIIAYYICKLKFWQKINFSTWMFILTGVIFVITMCFHNKYMLFVLILLLMCTNILSGNVKALNTCLFKKITIMGNWTFSYFLIHLYVVRFAELFGGIHFTFKAVICDLVAIVVAWGISYVLYELIEKRFTNYLKERLL